MNLTTHTVYQEISINAHNVFEVKLLDEEGVVMFEDMGAGKDKDDARARAMALVAEQEPNFIRGE